MKLNELAVAIGTISAMGALLWAAHVKVELGETPNPICWVIFLGGIIITMVGIASEILGKGPLQGSA